MQKQKIGQVIHPATKPVKGREAGWRFFLAWVWPKKILPGPLDGLDGARPKIVSGVDSAVRWQHLNWHFLLFLFARFFPSLYFFVLLSLKKMVNFGIKRDQF